MLRSMYSGISGMKANQTKLDVTANNLANVSTTGFKKSQARFKDMLYQNSSNATAATTYVGGTNAKQVGLGAQVSSITKLVSQGNALSTSRSLDCMVDGEGYFIVAKSTTDGSIACTKSVGTPDSKVSGTYYTRDGNFVLDDSGSLLTADGYRVMGYYSTSATYTVPSTTTDWVIKNPPAIDAADYKLGTAGAGTLKPLSIPQTITVGSDVLTVESFAIGKDGVITVNASGKNYVIGQIGMASFTNPEGLNQEGSNLLTESGNSGTAVIRDSASADAAKSNAGAYGSCLQGYLEASNVDITDEFTDMITATRAFQAASKMISNGDEILQTVTGLVR